MIEVRHLEKSFKLYHRPADRLREIVYRRRYHTPHHALKDISFQVNAGETLGIIGRNGAGKSTLLKILNSVLLPDSGTVVTHGRVTGLLELGTGFDFGMSGLQNILTNGLLLGMTEREIAQRQSDIIAFAELGEFINEPIRTYSSGMIMRLAFAIAIHADPDSFLIDEALSVGDGRFQQKCMRRIREFRQQGGSIIFVSHDLNAVKVICDRVIVLDEGTMAIQAGPEEAVNHYNQILAGELGEEGAIADTDNGYGNYQAEIIQATATSEEFGTEVLASGENLILSVWIQGRQDVPDLTLGLMIRDRFGQDIFGTNTHLMGHPLAIGSGEKREIRLCMPMTLAPGKYTITLALHEGADHTKECYHWWDSALHFEISGIRGLSFSGLCNLSPTIEQL
jgi:homopolymeric O-antigen transport system ATP-binding protein